MSPALQSRSATGCELAAEVARRFGEVRFRAQGASMLPSVLPGDVLTVRRQAARNLRPGEIVLAQRGPQLVAHRIVNKQGTTLITRGDSLPYNDAPVEESEIVGRVVSVTRAGRAVDTRFTMARRMGAWALRRSELAVRVLLKWKRLARGLGPVDRKYEG